MGLPDKAVKYLFLGLLAVFAAGLLSPLVFPAQTRISPSISGILSEGPLVKGENWIYPVFMMMLIPLALTLALVKGYKFCRHNQQAQAVVKNYKEALNRISSLKERMAGGKLLGQRRKKAAVKKKSLRLSQKQAKKLVASSTALKKYWRGGLNAPKS